jgi:hypothetical protein
MDRESIEVISAKYQTKVTEVTGLTIEWTKIADRNPRRVYIDFRVQGGLTGQLGVIPEPGQNITPQSFDLDPRGPYLWKDCPSMVTGEWYAVSGLATGMVVIEVEYVGG